MEWQVPSRFLDFEFFDFTTYDPDNLSPSSPWQQATVGQLLRLLKVLEVEQTSIATYLGVTTSTVSMWLRGHRPVPTKYRPAVLAYAKSLFPQAITRQHKAALALPEPLQQATRIEFTARLHRWQLEVQHANGVLQHQIQEDCRTVGRYTEVTTLTDKDRQDLMQVCRQIQSHLRVLDLLETPGEPEIGATNADADEQS